jgi:hypothetical protein
MDDQTTEPVELPTPSHFENNSTDSPPFDSTPAFANYPLKQKKSFTKVIYFSFFSVALLALVLGLYLKYKQKSVSESSIQPLTSVNNTVSITPPSNQCVIYAVSESGDNDSQLITIDPKTKTITPLGDLQKGMQIENVAFDQQTKTLFANSSNMGQIYSVDTNTGMFSSLGQAHSGEITAFTVHPTDGSQWGWAKEDGLIAIQPTMTGDKHLYPSLKRGSALTWNTDGTLLYGTFKDNTELFTYDTNKNTYNPLAYNLPTATRGLSMLSGDILLGINSNKEGTIHIYEFDPIDKLVTKELTIESSYGEPRGIAWDPSCGDPL